MGNAYLQDLLQEDKEHIQMQKQLSVWSFRKIITYRIKQYKRFVTWGSKYRKRKRRNPRRLPKSTKKLNKLKKTLKITKRKKKKTTKKINAFCCYKTKINFYYTIYF